jgi:hypothetical protein
MNANPIAARAYAALQADGAEEFKDLPSLATKLSSLKKIQKDHRLKLWDLNATVVENDVERPGGIKSWSLEAKIGKSGFAFREHAYDQLCARIKFPADTLAKCPRDLADQNLSYFSLLAQDDKLLVKTEGEAIRAVLSERYETVEHLEIVKEILGSEFDFDVNYAGLTAKRMFVLAIDKNSRFDGPDGSKLQRCTLVGNSETGEGSFFAQDLLFDHV